MDQFVLDQVFNYCESQGDSAEYWWREVVEPGEGYVIVWIDEDGNMSSHHTYRYPPDIWS